jgi:hypothetical protein
MSEVKEQRPEKKRDKLFENNMGLNPSAVVYQFGSNLIEKTVMAWLKARHIDGVDNGTVYVRAILKSEWSDRRTLVKPSNSTKFPFLVVLFKELDEGTDFFMTGGMDAEVRNNIRAMLNNFRDSAQFHLKEDTPLNKLLTEFNGNHKVTWYPQKKTRRAYTVLDTNAVMGLCFKLSRNELTQYTWDYLENPKSKFNPDTRRREFWSNIAFSRTKSKRRPEHDPLNDIQ